MESSLPNDVIPPSSKNSISNDFVGSNNRQWNNKHNVDPQKTKFLSNNIAPNSGGKSWNSIVPEAEKPNRLATGKGKFTDKILTASDEETTNNVTNSAVTSNAITSNSKKRTLPVDEISDKESDISNVNVNVDQSQSMIMNNLNGKTESAVSPVDKINDKIQNKNKKLNMSESNSYDMDDEIHNSLSMDNHHRTNRSPIIDGISTPPMTPTTSQSSNSNSVDDLQITTTELSSSPKGISSPPTPPPSSGSDSSDNSLTPTKTPRLSASRPIISSYMLEMLEQEEQEKRLESVERDKNNDIKNREGHKEPEKLVDHKNEDRQDNASQLKKGRRPTISHDDMIIPTIAKKLKMNGQLPYQNHDALLGTYDDPDQLDPSLNSYTEGITGITTVNVLFNENKTQSQHQHRQKVRKHGDQTQTSSVPEHKRIRRNSNSQKPSKIPSRIQNGSTSSNTDNDKKMNISREKVERVEGSSGPHADDAEEIKNKRKSRREEFILVIRDEDEENEFGDFAKPSSLTVSFIYFYPST